MSSRASSGPSAPSSMRAMVPSRCARSSAAAEALAHLPWSHGECNEYVRGRRSVEKRAEQLDRRRDRPSGRRRARAPPAGPARASRAACTRRGGCGSARAGSPSFAPPRGPPVTGRRSRAPPGHRRRGCRGAVGRGRGRTRRARRRRPRTASRARAHRPGPRGRGTRARLRERRALRGGASCRSLARRRARAPRTAPVNLGEETVDRVELRRATDEMGGKCHLSLPGSHPRSGPSIEKSGWPIQGGRLMSGRPHGSRVDACPATCFTTTTSRTSAVSSSPPSVASRARFVIERRWRHAAPAATRSGGRWTSASEETALALLPFYVAERTTVPSSARCRSRDRPGPGPQPRASRYRSLKQAARRVKVAIADLKRTSHSSMTSPGLRHSQLSTTPSRSRPAGACASPMRCASQPSCSCRAETRTHMAHLTPAAATAPPHERKEEMTPRTTQA